MSYHYSPPFGIDYKFFVLHLPIILSLSVFTSISDSRQRAARLVVALSSAPRGSANRTRTRGACTVRNTTVALERAGPRNTRPVPLAVSNDRRRDCLSSTTVRHLNAGLRSHESRTRDERRHVTATALQWRYNGVTIWRNRSTPTGTVRQRRRASTAHSISRGQRKR